VKQGLDPELVNTKHLVLSDDGAGLWTYVYLITAKVTMHGDAGGLRCDASGLHLQHVAKLEAAMQIEAVAGVECKTGPSTACSMKETLTIE
jgi:hypothetical protein